MPPLPYAKRKNADLDALLQLRGLQTGGTKIDKISRLVMQDQEDEKARKATEARVRAASNVPTSSANATALQSSNTKPSALQRDSNRVREFGRTTTRATTTGSSGETALAQRNAGAERETENQDAYIKHLMEGPIKTATSISHQMEHTSTSPGIIVNMTPKGARNTTRSARSTASRLRQSSSKKFDARFVNNGPETVEVYATAAAGDKRRGRWGNGWVGLGALIVFGVILGMSFLAAVAVKWYTGM